MHKSHWLLISVVSNSCGTLLIAVHQPSGESI